MHAATSASLSAAVLLLSLALVVLVRCISERRAKDRPAFLEPAPEARPLPLLGTAERPVASAPCVAEPPRWAGARAEPFAIDSTALAGAALNQDASVPKAEAPRSSDASESELATTGAAIALVVAPEPPRVWIPPEAREKLRYPIVLAHGFGGFDAIRVGKRRLAYFRGVAEHLRAAGAEVYVLRVSPVAPIAVRAGQLAAQIRGLPAERVNIVAHSMGGLDARYAITELGIAPKIASLTTIGTPHRGTPLADLSMSMLSRARVIGKLGLSFDAFHDLTTTRMSAFNQAIEDAPSVQYGCFVASARRGVAQVNKLLVPGYLFLHWRAGDNDGVVPVASQRWGEVWGEIDVDHWGAVGWSAGFDAATFYEELLSGLRDRGL